MKKRKKNIKSAATGLWLPVALLVLAAAILALRPVRAFAWKSVKEKPYALIFGTVYGPDNHSAYGVRVKIRPANEKKAKWELTSDHRGEFAQRVPAGEADYIVWADVKTRKGAPPPEAKVHIQNDEREDVGLHLTE
ncbi:MAG TPA: hypothetical protein VK699_18940 [Terriglobales bacterium]|jgi:hypothetical protein|nr:hypothetical protein [Terriglobales bacterium]